MALDEADLMNVPGDDETAIDRSVKPCVDFYQFACGGFLASLPPETHLETRHRSLQAELSARYLETLRAVVTGGGHEPRRDAGGE